MRWALPNSFGYPGSAVPRMISPLCWWNGKRRIDWMKKLWNIRIVRGYPKRGWHTALSDDPQGRIYNLDEIIKSLFDKYKDIFRKEIYLWEPTVKWSKYPWKTSIAFIEISKGTNRISVNRVLDSKDVPLIVVEYILFHEMIHALLKKKVEKMNFDPYPDHGVHFRWLMEKYEHYHAAKEWLDLNWHRLAMPEKKKKGSPKTGEVGAEQVVRKKSQEVTPNAAG
jgi:hypothetical protein